MDEGSEGSAMIDDIKMVEFRAGNPSILDRDAEKRTIGRRPEGSMDPLQDKRNP